MYKTLSCVPKTGLSTQKYGDIFNYICGSVPLACVGINGNTTTGVYGAFSMCDDTQKLGFVLDQYYKSQNNAAGACGFNGQAVTTTPSSAASTCSAALSSASAANSVAATATQGSTSKTSNPAMPMTMNNMLTTSEFAVAIYILVATGLGAGYMFM
jgi:hypothetical protein